MYASITPPSDVQAFARARAHTHTGVPTTHFHDSLAYRNPVFRHASTRNALRYARRKMRSTQMHTGLCPAPTHLVRLRSIKS